MDLFTPRPRAPQPDALSVTQLVRRIKIVLENGIGSVWTEGEVSNLRKQGSGHWYFTLKDDNAQIACVMFGASRKPGASDIADGALIRVLAETSIYEARGQLQIVVARAERAGLGDLQARFEALKKQLAAEGLFESFRKKPIPKFPTTIGIITSDTGAVIRDICNVLQRRAPWVQPVLLPVRVQGKGAELEIAHAIDQLGHPATSGLPRCDVLIVGRGGGSLEDLWCFNEECVARAIARCPIPLISAVGHETDFTIADFVADLRAPTPSAAAELAVPDGTELTATLAHHRGRMLKALAARMESAHAALSHLKRGPLQRSGDRILREPSLRVDAARDRLNQLTRQHLLHAATRIEHLNLRHRAHHPAQVLTRRLDHLQLQKSRLTRAATESLRQAQAQLANLALMLRTLGPESAFQRGFSITLGPDGKALRSVAKLHPNTPLVTKLADGEIHSTVAAITPAPARPLR